MKLRKLSPINFGPFYRREVSIPIEDGVTVLTGPNDSGKTLLLRLVAIALGEVDVDETLASTLCNTTFAQEVGQPPREIDDFGCDAVFVGTTLSEQRSKKLAKGSECHVEFRFTPGRSRRTLTQIVTPAGVTQSANSVLEYRPRLLRLPFPDAVRDSIDLGSPTKAEQSLLRAAFGANFNVDRWKAMRPEQIDSEIRQAEDRLNDALRALMPVRTGLTARFTRSSAQSLGFSLRDEQGSLHPFTFRGGGLQAIVAHIAGLLDARQASEHVIVLFDEPEAGLHADLQHTLRGLLEVVAREDHVQVLLTTHSPSMINTRRPGAIRLLRKESVDDQTRVGITERPYGENWHALREGLGLTPADSLLYGDVTFVVEGYSELLALPTIFDRLAEGGVTGFNDAMRVIEAVHFLPGEGDSFEYLVRLAASQGNRVVVLLDSDKTQAATSIRKRHPTVPIHLLPEGMESEDLVPKPAYFESLGRILEQEAGVSGIQEDSFNAWQAAAALPEKMLFSKRVVKWLEETYEISGYAKPEVLRVAAEIAPVNELALSATPLLEVLDALRTAGSSSSPAGRSLPTIRRRHTSGGRGSASGLPSPPTSQGAPSPLAALKVLDVSETTPMAGVVTVSGRVLNASADETFEMIQIAVDALAANGSKLGTQNTLTHPTTLAPGEKASFTAHIHLRTPEGYKSVTAEILAARRGPR